MPNRHPILLLLALIVETIVLIWAPSYQFPFWWWVAGLANLAIGVLLVVAVVRCFRAAKTPTRGTPTALVTGGPYALARHPMYLGFAFILAGLALSFSSCWALIVCLLYMLLVHLRIMPAEEKVLEEKFGDDYLAYKKRVGRWVRWF